MKTIQNAVSYCLTLIFATALCSIGYAQTLTSNAGDYHPGSTATLSGSGFGADEVVTLRVTHNPSCCDDATAADHQAWNVTADDNGAFTASWYCPADQDESGASLIANATGQTSGGTASVTFTDSPIPTGTGVVSLSSGGGSCNGYNSGNQVYTFYVAPGGSYSMTLTGVTECTDNAITVFVQSSSTGNWCFNSYNDGSGNYTGTFTMPNPACYTLPVSYKCGENQPCDNGGTYNAQGFAGQPQVHLGAALFGDGCSNPVINTNCNTIVNIPPSLSCADAGSDLGCYSTSSLIAAPQPVTPTASNGCLPLGAITYSDGAATSTGGCGWSITRTWSVTDACGQTATCNQVYTYSQADAPVFVNLPVGGDLGCNPQTLPSCVSGVQASNQCGAVNASCSDGGVVTVDACHRSETFTYSATASCGGSVSQPVVYTWSVSTPVTISADGPLNRCFDLNDCVTLTATGANSYVWSNGETDNQIDICSAGDYSASVVGINSCGCSSAPASVNGTIYPEPTCNLDPIPEANQPVANSNNNQICADGLSAGTYTWTLTSSDGSWTMTSGQHTACLIYHCGTFGSSATFTITVMDSHGCTHQCSLSISPEAHEQCAYTQGFYGQTNGVTTCVGMPAPRAVAQALKTTNAGVYNGVCNPIIVGTGTKKITVGCNDSAAVVAKLPANATPVAIPTGGPFGINGASSCAGCAVIPSSFLQNGKIKDVLVGEAITLSINIRLFPGLANLHLTTPSFTTYASSDCDPSTAQIIPGSQLTFTIPQSVINCLGANNSGGNKVSNLLNLANLALGGSTTGAQFGCLSGCPTLTDINNAIDAINNGFDRCRIISGFNLRPEDTQVSTSGKGDFNFAYYPNPSNGITKALFVAPSDGNAKMEVVNINGSVVSTLFNQGVTEGQGYNVEFNTSSWSAGVYFIRTTVGDASAFGKIVVVK